MNIALETLNLVRYDENKHKFLLDELEKGESSSDFIHQIGQRLVNSKSNDRTVFQSGFVVEDKGNPIGYLYISYMQKDEVYIEYSVLKSQRGKGYGRTIINEATNYLFSEHNIWQVKLDISPSNKNSMYIAESCGFEVDEDDFVEHNFSGNMVFFKESDCYIPKMRR